VRSTRLVMLLLGLVAAVVAGCYSRQHPRLAELQRNPHWLPPAEWSARL